MGQVKTQMLHALELAERCKALLEQVQVLSQSLVGLGACVMNWAVSSEIEPPLDCEQRARVAELVLQYSLPCKRIDAGISNLCAEVAEILENNRLKVTVDRQVAKAPLRDGFVHHYAPPKSRTLQEEADRLSFNDGEVHASLWKTQSWLPRMRDDP